jgi:hypothetical protein
MIGRCLANAVVYWTKDTDIGAMISKATEAATTRIEDGIDVLRDEPLFTAADELTPLLLDLQLLEDETDQGRLGRFVQDAMVVYHTAHKAFNTVKTVPAKIRAVKIACIAIAATDVADSPDDTKDEQRIRNHLGCQIQKLWTRVPKVQQEVAASLGSTRSSALKGKLDVKAKREDRVRSAVSLLVQAESYCAVKGLRPIYEDFLGGNKIPEAVAALVRTGLFGGSTVAELDQLRRDADPRAFSAKELYVVAGFLGEPYQKPDDVKLFILSPAAEKAAEAAKAAAAAKAADEDIDVLLALRNALTGRDWLGNPKTGLVTLGGWADLETHRDPSKCEGIQANKVGQVTKVDISSKGLSGVLPKEVGQLGALEVFKCSENKFTGKRHWEQDVQYPYCIPSCSVCSWLCSVSRMRSDCGWLLTGQLPSFAQNVKLERFYCSGNQFTGIC